MIHFRAATSTYPDTSMQIWGVVAGESAFFTKQQFYSAMRLLSVAQVHQSDM